MVGPDRAEGGAEALLGPGLRSPPFWAGPTLVYPEGCSFAILIMNAVCPLINRWTQPKPFGRKK